MILFSEMFLSELLNVPVIDRLESPVGKVKDALIVLGEPFPKVTGLLIETRDGRMKVLTIGEIDLIGSHFVSTRSAAERLVLAEPRDNEIMLARDILDRQVVDTDGARVHRVNDLKLAKVGYDVRLTAADVGMRGVLRRLSVLQIVESLARLLRVKVRDVVIGWNHVELLEADLAKGKITIPHKRVEELHPADIADIISHVHSKERSLIFASLSDKTAAEALHELEPKIQAMLLLAVDTKKALGVLTKMPADEVADVLGDIPEEKAEGFLRLLRPKRSAEIRKLLKHPDKTAGGLMTTEFISFPQDLTAEQTINKLRELAPNAETVYYIFITDPDGVLVGALSLRALIIASPETPIADIMSKQVISVQPEANQKQVADVISKYNLLAVPVVDQDNKMLGIVTVDDVMDFILPPMARRKRYAIG